MPTTSIKISQLDPISSLTGSDFFPIDQSSSIKTYRASLTQLQDLFSTGSFTGSVIGTIVGTGTSPQFVGTSSWAISSSRSISSSYSDFSNSSSYALSSSNALTASYALNSNAGDLSGAGTTNYLPIWTGNKTLGNSSIYYRTPLIGYPGNVSTDNFYVQKDTPIIYITGSGQGSLSVVSSYNSAMALRSATTSSDAHIFVVGADGGMPGTDSRGVFDWSSFSGSNNLASRQGNDPVGDGSGQTRLLRIKSNGWYFWPLYGAQTISRDGTFNIGVDSGTENHDTRLKIFVYSGSSVSNPVVNHIRKAIEVTYGSGSEATTFCVSSSGKTYIGDKLEINGGVQLKTDTVYSAITSLGQNVSINAENYTTKFLNLGNHGTASITMSRGSQLNLIVNQAATSDYTASLFITGSYISSSGQTFDCPIVWRNGTSPSITTGNANRADFFSFVAVNTHNNGPKGSGAPNNTVIYATVVQNMY